MTLRTYYPDPEPTFAPPPGPDRCDGLRWGLTLLDLHRATRMALARNVGVNAFSRTERYDIAWTAAATALYEADEPVTLSDLASAGWQAIAEARITEMRHHGIDHTRRIGEGRPRFAAYWHTTGGEPVSERVCEEIALAQIWPRLTPGQREALAALAAFGTATAAAAALGKHHNTFHKIARNGRVRFKTLWFEGEEVPPAWGRDTRGTTVDPQRARRAIKRRARKARQQGGADHA